MVVIRPQKLDPNAAPWGRDITDAVKQNTSDAARAAQNNTITNKSIASQIALLQKQVVALKSQTVILQTQVGDLQGRNAYTASETVGGSSSVNAAIVPLPLTLTFTLTEQRNVLFCINSDLFASVTGGASGATNTIIYIYLTNSVTGNVPLPGITAGSIQGMYVGLSGTASGTLKINAPASSSFSQVLPAGTYTLSEALTVGFNTTGLGATTWNSFYVQVLNKA
jgi:hypothetical protein